MILIIMRTARITIQLKQLRMFHNQIPHPTPHYQIRIILIRIPMILMIISLIVIMVMTARVVMKILITLM